MIGAIGVAINIGNPGEGALKRGLALTLIVVVGGSVMALILVGLTAWSLGRSGPITGLVVLVMLGLESYLMRNTFSEIRDGYLEGRSWLKGAQGESLVNQALAGLSDDFIVFHDFHPVSSEGLSASWNVDHICIGPTGVFVIETKNYSVREIRLSSGYTKKNISQVDHNALGLKRNIIKWTAGELGDLFVVPVLVYSQPDVRIDRLREGSVRVLPLRLLTNEIKRHSEASIDMDKAHRLARVLFHQLSVGQRAAFEEEMLRYGRAARISTNQLREQKAAASAGTQVACDRQPPVEVKICPRCGAPLVMRTAKKGSHAGGSFWGCSNYPKCRYIGQLEPGTAT